MITEVGKVLSGKLLVFDAGFTSFHTIKLRDADPACVVCGDNPTVRGHNHARCSAARGFGREHLYGQ